MELLAPNGKPSNLTPEQYHLVRTPAFKAWFGDWENSPETASKVVDENGEPLVLNHTYETENAPNIFQKSKEVYIDGKYKRIFENDDVYEKLKGIYGTRIIDGVKYNVASDYWEFWFTNKIFGAINNTDKSRMPKHITCFLNIRNLYITENGNGGQGSFGNTKSDYDGISGVKITNADNQKGADYYIVLFSNQIKLADGRNTTFDVSNPDIRFKDGGEIEITAKAIEQISKKQREEELKRLVKYKKELDYNIENKDYKDTLADVQQIGYVNSEIYKIKLKIKIDKIREQLLASRSNIEWDKYTKLEQKYLKQLYSLYSTPFYYSGYDGIKDIKGSSLDRFGKKSKSLSEAYHKAKLDGSNPELVNSIEDALKGTNTIYEYGGQLPDLLSSQEIEDKLGRELHWWNDDIVYLSGIKYKKVYLRPEYKRVIE